MRLVLHMTILAVVLLGCSGVYAPGGTDDCATLLMQFNTCGNSYRLTADEPGAQCRRYGDVRRATYFPVFPYPAGCAAKFSADSCCTSGADFYNACAATIDKDPYRCLRSGATCDDATGRMNATSGCAATDAGGAVVPAG